MLSFYLVLYKKKVFLFIFRIKAVNNFFFLRIKSCKTVAYKIKEKRKHSLCKFNCYTHTKKGVIITSSLLLSCLNAKLRSFKPSLKKKRSKK